MQDTYRKNIFSLIPGVLFVDFPLLLVFLLGFVTFTVRILRFINTKVVVGKTTLTLESGVFSKQVVEFPYTKINSIKVDMGIIGSIFNYGTIRVAVGNDTSTIEFKGIEQPKQLQALINSKI